MLGSSEMAEPVGRFPGKEFLHDGYIYFRSGVGIVYWLFLFTSMQSGVISML